LVISFSLSDDACLALVISFSLSDDACLAFFFFRDTVERREKL